MLSALGSLLRMGMGCGGSAKPRPKAQVQTPWLWKLLAVCCFGAVCWPEDM